jgi:hypothetical protein
MLKACIKKGNIEYRMPKYKRIPVWAKQLPIGKRHGLHPALRWKLLKLSEMKDHCFGCAERIGKEE